MRTAIICGASGQDGSYLAQHLLARGYRVIGTGRQVGDGGWPNHAGLGLADRVPARSLDALNPRAIANLLEETAPEEVYFLAGQTSVGRSFEEPAETFASITIGTQNWLDAIRSVAPNVRFYNAGSSEAFGDCDGQPATLSTPLRPCSPYGVAKAAAQMLVRQYREAFGLFAVNGILFNHESPLRPAQFVTQKIASGVVDIAQGRAGELRLGALTIARDWGWAPDYVQAMHLLLEQDQPADAVICTGTSITLNQFAKAAFAEAGLDASDYVVRDPALVRPSELQWSGGDPSGARDRLGWVANIAGEQVARAMVRAEMSSREIA